MAKIGHYKKLEHIVTDCDILHEIYSTIHFFQISLKWLLQNISSLLEGLKNSAIQPKLKKKKKHLYARISDFFDQLRVKSGSYQRQDIYNIQQKCWTMFRIFLSQKFKLSILLRRRGACKQTWKMSRGRSPGIYTERDSVT